MCVKPGEINLADGKITEESTIDESMITGEPIQADKKKVDDSVVAEVP
jgi:Cu2+-exporting ATPase